MAYNETVVLDTIKTLLETLDNYSDENISIVDTKPLDAGVDRAVILLEGAFASENIAMGFQATTTYRFLVRVYHKYIDDAETQENLRADVKAIRELLDGYYKANAQVQSSKVVSGSAPVYVGTLNGSGPYFMLREMIYQVEKTEVVTGRES